MRRPGMWIALGAVTLGVVLFGASGCGSSSSGGNASNVSTGATGSTTGKPGGTIKAAWHGGIDFIDPALAYYQESWQIEYATCVNLLGYPDKPAPEGYQLQPEAASAMPTVSSDGLTVTFTVPPGKYKFNTGEPVTAQTFADSLMRDLNPKQVSPFVSFVASSIEGADRLERQGHHPGRPGQRRSADPAPDEAERHDRGRDGHAVHVRDPARSPCQPEGRHRDRRCRPLLHRQLQARTGRWWSRRTPTTPDLVRT